jgi:putative transposase
MVLVLGVLSSVVWKQGSNEVYASRWLRDRASSHEAELNTEAAMPRNDTTIPLPKEWPKHIRTAVLSVISLARLALVAGRGQAARSRNGHARLRAELEAARGEIVLLERELEIKDLRMSRVQARARPHYRPAERLAIFELRAARGWSRRETASRFLLQPATVAAWVARADEGGAGALLEGPAPANRLPDFIGDVVRRLKALCPVMGKKRIAQTLARTGLVLATSTVGRLLKERRKRPPKPDVTAAGETTAALVERRPVKARKPNDVWQVDLTLLPTAAGFWTAWFPFAIPQIWPFCWWIACAVDQYSRRVVGFRVFAKEPRSLDMRNLLARTISEVGATPRYVVSDKGRQFDARAFRLWCKRPGIRPRYAAAGSLRACAIIERFFRSLKEEWLRRILVPLRRDRIQNELLSYFRWFETSRPHQGLGGRTPHEVYETSHRHLPIAKRPLILIDRNRPFELVVHFQDGRRQLPIVELRQAA